jgi:hypothetical protein
MRSDIPDEFRGRGEVMLGFAESAAELGNHFFYVRIYEPLAPLDRGDRYEDPLQEALSAAGVGEVTGGGSQLGEGNTIAYCGLDVVVSDRDHGLAVIQETMLRLGAPLTTVIEEYVPAYAEHAIK